MPFRGQVLIVLLGLAASATTLLPVWSNDTGHGPPCGCSESFRLAESGLFLPSLLISVAQALPMLLALRSRARAPLPSAELVGAPWRARVRAWLPAWKERVERERVRLAGQVVVRGLIGLAVVGTFLVLGVLLIFPLEGAGALPGTLAHVALIIALATSTAASKPLHGPDRQVTV